ncbi:hypothetical protein CYMTET_32883 [Cymbomonas tetramitiformis]|uniref:MINDY deubiquitinase domain-containing protein n=1 Tax=Cymbomonas tetramitiformis TaxID=36881 RepID=A0AAE0FE78_9CHLO|nr:hypothetical protein CYMTET_32883 [Cymbomonas tetramitiformis]
MVDQSSGAAGGVPNESSESKYKLKRIEFLGRNIPIVLQNENGPCPLLAIANVLLLRGVIRIRGDHPDIAHSDLLQLVVTRLLDANLDVERKGEEYARNAQQNMGDAIAMLPKLATGLDVNVRFRHIRDFEFTNESTIFDLLDVELVHGWLVDPKDEATTAVVGSRSYNELVERVITAKTLVPDTPSESSAAVSGPTASTSDLVTANAFSQEDEELQLALALSLEKMPDDLIDMNEIPMVEPTREDKASQPQSEVSVVLRVDELSAEPVQVELLPAKPPAPAVSLIDQLVESGTATEQDVGIGGKAPSTTSVGSPSSFEAASGVSVGDHGAAAAWSAASFEESAPAPEEGSSMGTEDMTKLLMESSIIENFLSQSASQLTACGLGLLHRCVRERALCVFFRNNHFSTLFKLDDRLYLLATDQGYLQEPELVWERLSEVSNDTAFVTGHFKEWSQASQPPPADEAWVTDAATQAAALLSEWCLVLPRDLKLLSLQLLKLLSLQLLPITSPTPIMLWHCNCRLSLIAKRMKPGSSSNRSGSSKLSALCSKVQGFRTQCKDKIQDNSKHHGNTMQHSSRRRSRAQGHSEGRSSKPLSSNVDFRSINDFSDRSLNATIVKGRLPNNKNRNLV